MAGGMPTLGGNGGLGMNMGGVLIDNRFPGNQMQPQMDFNYSNENRSQKQPQRRPSTNKLSHDQNSMQN